MNLTTCSIVCVGVERREFEDKVFYKGHFLETIPESEGSGNRSFATNISEDLRQQILKIGFNKSFKACVGFNKRAARASGNFTDYITEYQIVLI